MNQQGKQKEVHQKLSIRAQVGLIISLVVISIFPIFATSAPQEWPPQPMVVVIDAVYLLILAGYLLVLTGQNRSKWLVVTITVIGVIGILVMGWLAITLNTLEIRW